MDADEILLADTYKRLEALEDTARRLENSMDIRTLKWKTRMDDAGRDAGRLRSEIEQLKGDFSIMVTGFLSMVEYFKSSAEREDFEKIKSAVNEWDPESLISLQEFKKLIMREISARQDSVE